MDNQQPRLYHYVYLVTNGSISYVGSRSSTNKPEEDTSYISSSTDLEFKKSITKKFILKEFKSRCEACSYEANLHINWQVDINPLFANKAKASVDDDYGFIIPVGFKWTEEQKRGFSERKKQNPTIFSKEVQDQISLKNSLKSSEGLYRNNIVIREKNRFTKPDKHMLMHHTGLSFYGTMQSFIDLFDLNYGGVSELLLDKIKVHRGWRKVQRPELSS